MTIKEYFIKHQIQASGKIQEGITIKSGEQADVRRHGKENKNSKLKSPLEAAQSTHNGTAEATTEETCKTLHGEGENEKEGKRTTDHRPPD